MQIWAALVWLNTGCRSAQQICSHPSCTNIAHTTYMVGVTEAVPYVQLWHYASQLRKQSTVSIRHAIAYLSYLSSHVNRPQNIGSNITCRCQFWACESWLCRSKHPLHIKSFTKYAWAVSFFVLFRASKVIDILCCNVQWITSSDAVSWRMDCECILLWWSNCW